MKTTRPARLIALTICVLMLGFAACKSEKAKERLYFEDLRPPVGAGKVEIVKDVSDNPSTGGEIAVNAVVDPDIDKDELDRKRQVDMLNAQKYMQE